MTAVRKWDVYLSAEFDPLRVEAESLGWDKAAGHLGFYTDRVPVAVFAPGMWIGFVEITDAAR